MITVHNLSDWPAKPIVNTMDVYIGREQSYRYNPKVMVMAGLGNPYPVRGNGRATAIALFDRELMECGPQSYWRQSINKLVEHVREGGSLRLWCFCAPLPCHGDVIRREVLRLVEQADRAIEDHADEAWRNEQVAKLREELGE